MTDAGSDFLDLRDRFPATRNWTYLDSSSTGLLPTPSRDAVRAFLDDCVENGATKPLWNAALDGARAGFARLINASPEDVCFTKNCTEGVNIVANGLDWQPGDNVVLCGALEHPANILPWLNCRERGLELRTVAPRDQAIDPDALLAAADSRTRCIAVSSVSFVPGFRTNLASLARYCRAHDVFLLVDGTQAVGVLDTDVEAIPVDGLAVSTHKYLLSFYGQGLFWCRRSWAERMRPAHFGKPGSAAGDEHPADAGYTLALQPHARRFESGHLFVGAAALEASLDLLLEVGPRRIERHATALAALLARGFDDLELPLNLDPYGEGPTQIVTLGELSPDGLYGLSDPLLARLHERLNEAGVRHSARRGQLRFSFHLYNTPADVSRVLEVADAVVRG